MKNKIKTATRVVALLFPISGMCGDPHLEAAQKWQAVLAPIETEGPVTFGSRLTNPDSDLAVTPPDSAGVSNSNFLSIPKSNDYQNLPFISGGLLKSEVLKAFKNQKNEIQTCFSGTGLESRAVAGTWAFNLKINNEGQAHAKQLEMPEMIFKTTSDEQRENVVECLKAEIQEIQLTPPAPGVFPEFQVSFLIEDKGLMGPNPPIIQIQ